MSPSSDASSEKTPSQSPMQSLSGQFGDAYNKLIQASQQAAVQGQKQVEEAYGDLAKEIGDIQRDINNRYAEAYQQYVKAAQDAGGDQEAQQAYSNFIETVRGLEEDGVRRASEADTGFCTKVQGLASESQKQAQENYLSYLRSIQQAWAGLDVNSLN